MALGFFHEDDYCQVELLPAATRGYCIAEMGRIEEFADAHRDGAGFTDMYVRGEPPLPLASLGITVAALGSAVEPLVPRFADVLTGYSSYREPCPSVAGWGLGDGEAVFAGVGKGGVVGPVWLTLHRVPAERVGLWCRVLRSLPRAAELLVADWSAGRVVQLAEESALAAYLGSGYAPNHPLQQTRPAASVRSALPGMSGACRGGFIFRVGNKPWRGDHSGGGVRATQAQATGAG